jgi:hypothetical protein
MSTHVRGQNLTYSIANHIGIAIVTGVYSADNPSRSRRSCAANTA